MNTIFYHYNSQGNIIISYRDMKGNYIKETYIFYTLKEAILKFKKDKGLLQTNLEIIKIY